MREERRGDPARMRGRRWVATLAGGMGVFACALCAPRAQGQVIVQFDTTTRRNMGLLSAMQQQCARQGAAPAGYLGITFETPALTTGPDEVRVGEWPVVTTVEPGSPAQGAGLRGGDVLMAIGGYDARRTIPLQTILKPGATIAVRVQRDDGAHTVRVVVGKRPPLYGENCASAAELGAGAISFAVLTPRMYLMAATVAGAQVVPVDDDWRDATGVKNGLVVVTVARGTPAREAGLRGGDVIIAAGDTPIASVVTLQRLLGEQGKEPVTLQIVRKGKSRTITLPRR